MAYIPIIKYAVVIEQSGDAPLVVVFPTENEGKDFRDIYEAETQEVWDNDADWHNYPRQPIRVINAEDAMAIMVTEREEVKAEGGYDG